MAWAAAICSSSLLTCLEGEAAVVCVQKAASKPTCWLLLHHQGFTMSTVMYQGAATLTHLRVSGQIANCKGPCLQVRVSQRLAELARRPPVPVRISGRQVTEGPALERYLQGLIQQLSSTGETELLSSAPAQC